MPHVLSLAFTWRHWFFAHGFDLKFFLWFYSIDFIVWIKIKQKLNKYRADTPQGKPRQFPLTSVIFNFGNKLITLNCSTTHEFFTDWLTCICYIRVEVDGAMYKCTHIHRCIQQSVKKGIFIFHPDSFRTKRPYHSIFILIKSSISINLL